MEMDVNCAKTNDNSNTSCSCNGSCCNDNSNDSPVLQTGLFFDWVKGYIHTPVGQIPQISTQLKLTDMLDSWKARWGYGRMNLKIKAGLYAVGNPDHDSPVLVSANYKLSFDRLRRELTELNLWIIVLDTKGINVWCAAGKGTFGTDELVRLITQVKLPEIVAHRTLIAPQLGAPGIATHTVLKLTGFKVIYGPVRAVDLPDFLKMGLKATSAMRQVRFGFFDRLILTPIELVGIVKPAFSLIAVLFVINIINNTSAPFYQLISKTISNFIPFLGAILTGAVLVPILLPYIPGRALAWKGWLSGALWAGLYLWLVFPTTSNWLQAIIYFLFLPPIASYLAMNFTGATTYTSLSGVVKEMKIALPAQIISTGLGVGLLIGKLIIHL